MGSIINCMLKHKKLPLLHCYHTFSRTIGVYTLPKIIMRIIYPRWHPQTEFGVLAQ